MVGVVVLIIGGLEISNPTADLHNSDLGRTCSNIHHVIPGFFSFVARAKPTCW
jgi:hypothetical protein